MSKSAWNARVRKLNQGISPDDLPIEPPWRQLSPTPGHYSYVEVQYNPVANSVRRIKRWFSIRSRRPQV